MSTHIRTFLAALILTSCSSYYTPRYGEGVWLYEAFANCAAWYRSSHAYYPPRYPCGSLSIELIKDSGGIRMYINLLLVPVCPEDPWSDCIEFPMTIDGVVYPSHATVLEGGQRLMLDDAATARLINALLTEQTIHIQIGMHSSDISANCFGQAYEALLKQEL